MEKPDIKILIKHFDNKEEKQQAKKYARENGLKEFNSLGFQFKRIPEGDHVLDLEHIFDNQYNTTSGFRIFEYCESLSNMNARPLGYGYYIADGIKEIREYQKRVKQCGYCGAEYLDQPGKHWCDKCLGSQYLSPEYYKLLFLVPVLERKRFKYSSVKLPESLAEKIDEAQREARTKRLEKQKKKKIEELKQAVKDAEHKAKVFQWLIDHNFDYDNVIYYRHTKTFCFGWMNSLKEEQKTEVRRLLEQHKAPFKYEFK